MSKRTIAVCAALWTVLAATLFTPVITGVAAGSPSPAAGSAVRPVTARAAAVDAAVGAVPFSAGSMSAALASAALTPAQAVAQANSNAAANGINTYISVTDSRTGAVLAQTGNAGTQVASESVVKLMTAAYYLVIVGGYQNQSQSVLDQLSYMIRYSDDQTENDYFTSAAVPTIAARYGMGSTINATDRVGHWGAVRITARDMTTFLYRAFHDPQVGPWLQPVMAQVAPVGSDGFNQAFGMNSLSGAHGSKQGWGDDQFWTSASNVISSVGYTDRYLVAILQNSYSFPDPARGTSTFAARAIQASRVTVATPPPPPAPVVPRNGDFVSAPGVPGIYRLAGGAPIYVSSWAPFGRVQPVKRLTAAQWNALRKVPADGTFITSTGTRAVYRIAGGAPLYVSNWAAFGGVKPTVVVDDAAVFRAGRAGVWSHLLATPADGTFLTASGNRQVFRVVAGTPTYVTTWANWGGVRPTTLVDGAVFTHAGQPGYWSHLRNTLPDNTFIVGVGSGEIYRMAGGAPIFVSSWAVYGRVLPFQYVDAGAIAKAGTGGQFQHLLLVPANGTFLKAGSGGATYRIAGGAPLYVRPLTALATSPVVITIDPVAVANAGKTLKWSHLRRFPVDNTTLRGVPGNKIYRVTDGYARPFTSGAGAVPVNQSTIDLAGSGGYFRFLR